MADQDGSDKPKRIYKQPKGRVKKKTACRNWHPTTASEKTARMVLAWNDQDGFEGTGKASPGAIRKLASAYLRLLKNRREYARKDIVVKVDLDLFTRLLCEPGGVYWNNTNVKLIAQSSLLLRGREAFDQFDLIDGKELK